MVEGRVFDTHDGDVMHGVSESPRVAAKYALLQLCLGHKTRHIFRGVSNYPRPGKPHLTAVESLAVPKRIARTLENHVDSTRVASYSETVIKPS